MCRACAGRLRAKAPPTCSCPCRIAAHHPHSWLHHTAQHTHTQHPAPARAPQACSAAPLMCTDVLMALAASATGSVGVRQLAQWAKTHLHGSETCSVDEAWVVV